MTCSKTGYQTATQTGVNSVGLQTTSLNFVLSEITLPPAAVQAVEASLTTVNLSWKEPGTGDNISEGFEEITFPPTDWSQIITDTNSAGTSGVLPTWCQTGINLINPPVPPRSGLFQAAIWWDYSHQDEWLRTPQFICPSSANLTFWSYVYLGSTNGDHYYIKVSTDNGNTWTVLWDASALTGGWNYYATPIVIDLDAYAGQQFKLAWHADDPPSNDGIWHVWFIDDITVNNAIETIHFPINTLNRISARDDSNPKLRTVTPQLPTSRAMAKTSLINSYKHSTPETVINNDTVYIGYKVWRLLQGQENNESAWTLLTTDVIT
ncbi:MAG: choice-of-anchor J domain-containing protein, partial [Candidatus Syntrophosphaera sp.]|nr:choice-of-anchor J domain-containing protein [Candidatus Syntrophosphaera sp.]